MQKSKFSVILSAACLVVGIVAAALWSPRVEAEPLVKEGVVEMTISSASDDTTVRVYRSVPGQRMLVAEVQIDSGESVIQIRDGRYALNGATYELRWVAGNGSEVFVGKGGLTPLLHGEAPQGFAASSSFQPAVAVSQALSSLAEGERLVDACAETLDELLIDSPEPPPDSLSA